MVGEGDLEEVCVFIMCEMEALSMSSLSYKFSVTLNQNFDACFLQIVHADTVRK